MPIQEGISPEGVKEEGAPPESTKQEGNLPEGVEREKISQEEMQQDRIPQNGQNAPQKEGIQNDSHVPEGAGPGNAPQPEMSREGSGPPPP